MSNLYCSSGGSLAKALPRTMKQLAQSLTSKLFDEEEFFTSRTNRSAFSAQTSSDRVPYNAERNDSGGLPLNSFEHIFIDRSSVDVSASLAFRAKIHSSAGFIECKRAPFLNPERLDDDTVAEDALSLFGTDSSRSLIAIYLETKSPRSVFNAS